MVTATVLTGCERNQDNGISAEDLARLATIQENATSTAEANALIGARMRMQAAMANAQGINISETWVRKMIEHHRGAVALSEAVLAQGAMLQIREMARQTIEAERGEQREFERILESEIFTGRDASHPFAQAEARMNERMVAAVGDNPGVTWIRMMIELRRGAVQLANILVAEGGQPAVIALARRTAEKENREVEELERTLRIGREEAGAPRGAAPDGRAGARGEKQERGVRVSQNGRSRSLPAPPMIDS